MGAQGLAVQTSVVILLGPPGAGKGTQATRLAAARGLPHVSTGDLFRTNLARRTPIGVQAEGYMNAGQLVPDEVVLTMLAERVAAPDCRRGYLLDGFPRTLPQAEALDRWLAGRSTLLVVSLEASDEVIVARAAGRLVCAACGNVQHATFAAPRVPGRCDRCGGELRQREDDRPEVVRERLRVYRAQTEPLVRFYRERGLLRSVDGERSPDEVFQELQRVVPPLD